MTLDRMPSSPERSRQSRRSVDNGGVPRAVLIAAAVSSAAIAMTVPGIGNQAVKPNTFPSSLLVKQPLDRTGAQPLPQAPSHMVADTAKPARRRKNGHLGQSELLGGRLRRSEGNLDVDFLGMSSGVPTKGRMMPRLFRSAHNGFGRNLQEETLNGHSQAIGGRGFRSDVGRNLRDVLGKNGVISFGKAQMKFKQATPSQEDGELEYFSGKNSTKSRFVHAMSRRLSGLAGALVEEHATARNNGHLANNFFELPRLGLKPPKIEALGNCGDEMGDISLAVDLAVRKALKDHEKLLSRGRRAERKTREFGIDFSAYENDTSPQNEKALNDTESDLRSDGFADFDGNVDEDLDYVEAQYVQEGVTLSEKYAEELEEGLAEYRAAENDRELSRIVAGIGERVRVEALALSKGWNPRILAFKS